MKLKRKIATAIATGALLFNSFATSAFAATTLEISGNGTNSTNDANVSITRNNTVVQSNNADVNNTVNVNADTGGNKANDNTGGNVSIDTGKVDSQVKVSNTLNKNSAEVNCCPSGDTSVLISGNGSKSDNNIDLNQSSHNSVFQDNNADVKNKVKVDANTGKNDAKDNTGGDVSITTGKIDTAVTLSTSGNVNSAKIGDGKKGGSLSARIIGNGTQSDNDIDLDWTNDTLVVQTNKAKIDNDVKVDANTGKNDANDNTGGTATIDTGDADATVNVDNKVNFNMADVNCGCLLDEILAKISGNGSNSDNTIEASLDQSQDVFQDNCGGQRGPWELIDSHLGGKCDLKNKADVKADTGKNDAKDNTGKVGGNDPDMTTGDANADVKLNNSGNVNILGKSSVELPKFELGFNLTLNLSDLLSWLMSHHT